jgi:DNA-binding MarR family transcriptional regulator
MNNTQQPGLGELLRHLVDIIDRGSEDHYQHVAISFRPRYTPVMRALSQGACTVSDITQQIRITQGAVSQTLKLMQEDGLIKRKTDAIDTRQTFISLSAKGQRLLSDLEEQWQVRFLAITQLEKELEIPLCQSLVKAIKALEEKGFEERLVEAQSTLTLSKTAKK